MPVTRLDTSHLNSLSLMYLFVCFYMFLSMNLLAVCFMASICFGLSWCFTRFPDVFMIALPMSRTFGLFFSSFARAPFFGLLFGLCFSPPLLSSSVVSCPESYVSSSECLVLSLKSFERNSQ